MFGIGAGWYKEEFRAYNIPFLTLKERTEMVEEAIQIFMLLCEEKGPTSFAGKYYRVKEARFCPKPIQKPYPPIWIGGASNGILLITAKYAQGWIPYELPLNVMREKVERLKRLLVKNGRREDDVEIAISSRCIISDKTTEVKKIMKLLGLQRNLEGYRKIKSKLIVGTADEVVGELRNYVDIGVNHFCFGIQPSNKILEGLEFIKDNVISQL